MLDFPEHSEPEDMENNDDQANEIEAEQDG
jgi:hypothetical protein